MKRGGLGIRNAVHIAPPSYLASVQGSYDLVEDLLPEPLQDCSASPLGTSVLSVWRQGHEQSPPTPPAAHHQKVWDHPRVQARADLLLSEAPDAQTRACLIATSASESGA